MGRFFRRFFRYAFHAAAGFSVIVLIVCLIFWPLSYRRCYYVEWRSPRQCMNLIATPGRGGGTWKETRTNWGFVWRSEEFPHGFTRTWSYSDWAVTPPESWEYLRPWLPECCHDYLGVSLTHTVLPPMALRTFGARNDRRVTLDIPFSYLTLLAAILPALWLRGLARRRRRACLARRGFPVDPAA